MILFSENERSETVAVDLKQALNSMRPSVLKHVRMQFTIHCMLCMLSVATGGAMVDAYISSRTVVLKFHVFEAKICVNLS